MSKENCALKHIARENVKELLDEATSRGITKEDIIQIIVKGNTVVLIYAE